MSVRILCAVVVSALLSGCQHTPVLQDAESQLDAYVRASNFTLFVPPRDGDGAGSVVSFNDHREESIVASPADCFKPERVVPATQRVAVLDSDYELTTNDKVVMGLPALFKSRLDLHADLSRAGVAKVKYRLIEPYTTRITLVAARNYWRSIPADDACRKLVESDDNLLIHTVLGAKGIEYSFYGSNDAKMSVTAEILDVLKAEPTLASKYAGTSSIQLKDDMLLGYRAWQLVTVKGVVAGGREFIELSPADIERLRAARR